MGSGIWDDDEDAADNYLKILEDRGQLIDVSEDVDLSKIPSPVTHVRYPDGRVVRIRFY